jgi:threonine/homoserine/homoserine lactone efflux protein
LLIYLVMGITYGFASAVQPGPLQTFLISRTLIHGWRQTFPATLAPLVSDIPIVFLTMLILNKVPVWMGNILHLAGGLFLLYLAWGAYRSFRTYSFDENRILQSSGQNFFKAVTVNLLNPNPYLAWSLVMGPLLLKAWQETPVNGLALMAAFYGAMISANIVIIFAFAAIGKLGPKLNKILIGISVVALAGFGLYQLWLGLSAIL